MGQMIFPHVSEINEEASFLFVRGVSPPSRCSRCSRAADEIAVVRSAGSRIDVFYLRTSTSAVRPETSVPDPICWACVRRGSEGSAASHKQWRSAAAGFLNALHATDPSSYYCGVRDLA